MGVKLSQLSRKYGVEIDALKETIRADLGLTKHQLRIDDLPKTLGRKISAHLAGLYAETAPVERPAAPPRLDLVFAKDRRPTKLSRGRGGHPVFLHTSLVDDAEAYGPHVARRLALLTRHLCAHGRTSVVKGVRGHQNRGWRRSPLGGNGGMQFYLWWSEQGATVLDGLTLPHGAKVLRAVRHHDDHQPLNAADDDAYLCLSASDIIDGGYLPSPLSEGQVDFAKAHDPVRLLQGNPGSGKTTALWEAVELRAGERVLYLTWSTQLSQVAAEHFEAFADPSSEIVTLDLLTFFGRILGRDIEVHSLADAHHLIAKANARLPSNEQTLLTESVLAELRGYLVGRALPWDEGALVAPERARLSDEAFTAQRRRRGLSTRDTQATLHLVEMLERDEPIEALFPELVAAMEAYTRIERDGLPPALRGFDRVVVDEVQDLTLLELATLTAFVRALATTRGSAPFLLCAGDEGQTVRATAFRWSRLSDLLTARLTQPEKRQLGVNLRSPMEIAAVLERTDALYKALDKRERPRAQRAIPTEDATQARVRYLDIDDPEKANRTLRALLEVPGLIAVDIEGAAPGWLDDDLRHQVLSPEQIKGLERQHVCVLDVNTALEGAATLARSSGDVQRALIDRLRVALSRPTESLVVLDVYDPLEDDSEVRDLLGRVTADDPDTVVRELMDEDTEPEVFALGYIRDAESLLDALPAQAWQAALRALSVLGRPDVPGGVIDESVRRQAGVCVVQVAWRLLLVGEETLSAEDVADHAKRGAEEAGLSGWPALLRSALSWRLLDEPSKEFAPIQGWNSQVTLVGQTPASVSIDLCEGVLALTERAPWVEASLRKIEQRLRGGISSGFDFSPDRYTGDVAGWLRLLGDATDEIPGRVEALRLSAIDALVGSRRWDKAEALLVMVDDEAHERWGKMREAQGLHAEAAASFQAADLLPDALRNLRINGDMDTAMTLAAQIDPVAHADLSWLVEVKRLRESRPDGLAARLTEKERARARRWTHGLKI